MTTTNPCIDEVRVPLAVGTSISGLVRRALETMELWHKRARQRRELLEMPGYLLKDMGINAYDAYREYRKPFWRP